MIRRGRTNPGAAAPAPARFGLNTVLAARLVDGYETVNVLGDSRPTREVRGRNGDTPVPCVASPGKEPPMMGDEVSCIDIGGDDGAI